METKIDISHIPFSRYGAYLSVSKEENSNTLMIHNAGKRFFAAETLTLNFGDNEKIFCDAEPHRLDIRTESGTALIYIKDDRTLVLECRGIDEITLKMIAENGYGTELCDNCFKMISVNQNLYLNFFVNCGKGEFIGPFEKFYNKNRNRKKHLKVTSENGIIRMAVNLSVKEPKQIASPIDVEKDLNEINAQWQSFLSKMPHCTCNLQEENFVRSTWYTLWSSFARAEDIYQSDVMLMSKKFMSSVWSWDHCFNALIMAKISKEKAMEQFLAPFVLQSSKGALPDMWNPYMEITWGVTKPPIHGWCFSKLMDIFDFENYELESVYNYLYKWTDWWLTENDSDNDGIPEYPQGCDSGWDNSTIFDDGFFLESPDLSAFLILQMHTLSRIANRLNDCTNEVVWKEKSAYWTEQAKALTERLYAHSWQGERFVAKFSGSHEYDSNPTSLLTLMPLVLGEYLENDKRKKLLDILRKDFLTKNGLATEMPKSPKYESDGYWRGPIWAPTTYLIIDGLRRGGEKEFAEEIAKRYCKMSYEHAHGNYENFDAITGKGLRAPGYTWSSSVYMLLKLEYSK